MKFNIFCISTIDNDICRYKIVFNCTKKIKDFISFYFYRIIYKDFSNKIFKK